MYYVYNIQLYIHVHLNAQQKEVTCTLYIVLCILCYSIYRNSGKCTYKNLYIRKIKIRNILETKYSRFTVHVTIIHITSYDFYGNVAYVFMCY